MKIMASNISQVGAASDSVRSDNISGKRKQT